MLSKKIKPQHKVGIVALFFAILCSVITICCAILVVTDRPRSGNDLFRNLVLDPMPKSVLVLHSQDQTPDLGNRIWLHFKISPDDFNLVLASQNWKIDTETRIMYGNDSLVESWWNPTSLGENAVEYSLIFKSDGDRKEMEYMWVNSQRTEAYLFYINHFIR